MLNRILVFPSLSAACMCPLWGLQLLMALSSNYSWRLTIELSTCTVERYTYCMCPKSLCHWQWNTSKHKRSIIKEMISTVHQQNKYKQIKAVYNNTQLIKGNIRHIYVRTYVGAHKIIFAGTCSTSNNNNAIRTVSFLAIECTTHDTACINRGDTHNTCTPQMITVMYLNPVHS